MHLIWHLWNNQDTCLIIHRCQVISGAFSTKSYTRHYRITRQLHSLRHYRITLDTTPPMNDSNLIQTCYWWSLVGLPYAVNILMLCLLYQFSNMTVNPIQAKLKMSKSFQTKYEMLYCSLNETSGYLCKIYWLSFL